MLNTQIRFLVIVIMCFVATNSVTHADIDDMPNHTGDGCGKWFDQLFGRTVVFAETSWLTFNFRHSGLTPEQPSPGIVDLEFSDHAKFPDQVLFKVKTGEKVSSFEAAYYPYFLLTTAQCAELANADEVTVERVYQKDRIDETVAQSKPLVLTKEHRRYVRWLVDYGKGWKPPENILLSSGCMAVVLLNDQSLAGSIDVIKQDLKNMVQQRTAAEDLTCFIFWDEKNQLNRDPRTRRGVGVYQFGAIAGHTERAVATIESFQSRDLPQDFFAHAAVKSAVNHQVSTIVLLASGKEPIQNWDEAIKAAHRETVRVHVIYYGADEESKRLNQLKELAKSTNGTVQFKSNAK